MDLQQTRPPVRRVLITTYRRSLLSQPAYALLFLEDRLIAAHIGRQEVEREFKQKTRQHAAHPKDLASSLFWDDQALVQRYLDCNPEELLQASPENFLLLYDEIERVEYAYARQGRVLFDNFGHAAFFARDQVYFFSMYYEQDGALHALEQIFPQKATVVQAEWGRP